MNTNKQGGLRPLSNPKKQNYENTFLERYFSISIPSGAINFANIQKFFRKTKFFAIKFIHYFIDFYQ